MASLSHCPCEILEQILTDKELSPQDLSAISLTCHSLRPTAERLLYSAIDWTWTFDPKTEDEDPVHIILSPIVNLLRTIIQRPELGPLVKSFALRGDSVSTITHDFYDNPPDVPIPHAERVMLRTFIEALDCSDVNRKSYLMYGLRLGQMRALVALLLSRLPNLTYLFLGENVNRRGFMIRTMLGSVLLEKRMSSAEGFRHLRVVKHQLDKDIRHRKGSYNTNPVIFCQPALEHLTISMDNNETDNPVFSTECPAPDLRRLRSLDITVLRETGLAEILRLVTGLEKLSWEWHYAWSLSVTAVTDVVDLGAIVAALSPARETLTELSSSASTQSLPWPESGPSPPHIGMQGSVEGLAHLGKLSRLSLPICFLMGSMVPNGRSRMSACLPSNLESLTITFHLRKNYLFHESRH